MRPCRPPHRKVVELTALMENHPQIPFPDERFKDLIRVYKALSSGEYLKKAF